MINLLLAGAGGGVVRGLMGLTKHQLAYKEVEFKPFYFFGTVAVSGFIGLTVTWAIVDSGLALPFTTTVNTAIAFIIGYAGGDFIENLYKLLLNKPDLFK
jgi:hypothetical protein